MEGSRIKAYFLIVMPWVAILFVCVFLIITNTVTLSIASYAVDHDDNLYVGTTGKIDVYEGDKQIAQLSALTSKSYVFTIKNGTIQLADSVNVYTMDLSGNVIDERKDPGSETFYQIQRNSKSFVSSNGDRYCIQNRLGRTRIVKNDSETVYQISVLSVVVKILLALCGFALVVSLIWVVSVDMKLKHNNRTESLEKSQRNGGDTYET